MTLRAPTEQGYFVAGLDSDVRHPTYGGTGVECGPVVFVAVLWSQVGSVQPLRTDPRQKPCCNKQQTVRIVFAVDCVSPDSSTTSRPRSLKPMSSVERQGRDDSWSSTCQVKYRVSSYGSLPHNAFFKVC